MSPNTSASRNDAIPFARPVFGPEEEEAVVRVLRSGWLTTGSETVAFEREFAETVGAAHAVAVNSATAGLHLSLEALGVKPGDMVVTTPYTFTATAETIRYLQAHPRFVDIEEHSPNIDPELVEQALNEPGASKPVGIIPVHIGGEPCDMKSIGELARTSRIFVLEDSAHAFPSRTDLGFAGAIGDAGVFSFYASKTITTGEGGMIATGDRTLAERMSVMRLHGIDRTVWNRYTEVASRAWEYDVVAPGFKYNLPDTAAAIGRAQLKKAHAFLERRLAIARAYTKAFEQLDFLEVPHDADGHAWHLYAIRIKTELLSIGRDDFIAKLTDLGIGTSVHYKPLHMMSYYAKTYGLRTGDFPRATARFLRSISLPIYPSLSDAEVGRIIETVVSVGKAAWRYR